VVGIDDVILVEWKRYQDDRGWFEEAYHPDLLPAQVFVQDNRSRSSCGVVRGIHYQPDMGKLMRVTRGAAYLTAVDLRIASRSFGEHVGITLTEQDLCAVWAPAEFGRGFQALTDNTEIWYKCTSRYNSATEGAIRWDSVNIAWPLEPTIISPKDRTAQTFDEYKRNPRF
jgi:dTDP-4-dehydrorhamnose 3,5-epimerase